MRTKILFVIATAFAEFLSASLASSFMPDTFPSRIASRLQPSELRKVGGRTDVFRLHGGAADPGDDASLPETPPVPNEPELREPLPVPEGEKDEILITETKMDATSSEVENQGKMGPNAAPPGFLRRSLPGLPWHRLPNILTYFRCLAIPALVGLFYVPNRHVETSILFAAASYTDWLDGYLARRWDISSDFGAFLDPVADKLMVSTSLILLAGRYGAEVAIPTCIILAREIAVSALREWMAQRGKRDIVKVGYQGKVKTALTMFSITVLLLAPTTGGGPLTRLYLPGLLMMYLCTVITITSGSVYFSAAAPLLFKGEN